MSVTKLYLLQDKAIQVHQTHVCPCPSAWFAGYFWYGGKRRGPGRPPKWVDQLLPRDPDQPGDQENGTAGSTTMNESEPLDLTASDEPEDGPEPESEPKQNETPETEPQEA